MARIAVDFGTQNTIVARRSDSTGEAETLAVPGVTVETRFRSDAGGRDEKVLLAPSVIHYTGEETFIGAQVLAQGLLEDEGTVRWMKRSIAYGVTRRKKTPQGHKAPFESGAEYLRLLLTYLSDQVSFAADEFTFTAPVESFERYRDWLDRVRESLGIRRARFLDEATAAILARDAPVRANDRYLIVDFGCGTLDVSAVRLDLASAGEKAAVQLGQAGRDVGGMDIDRWIVADFVTRHGLDEASRRQLEPALLVRAEAVKIALSDPGRDAAVLEAPGGVRGPTATRYARGCGDCERGRKAPPRGPGDGCLGCILLEKDFTRHVRETVDRALENAAIKAGLRRGDLTRVVVTGGTSLIPAVRRLLEDLFGARIDYESPFDAVVKGACRGAAVPILQHDYAVESYDPIKKAYELRPLFRTGTEYPTPRGAVKLWAKGSHDGMTRIGIKVFEASQVRKRDLDASLVDSEGALLDASRVASDLQHICLNRDNPTFIPCDPPVSLKRDARRFLCSFEVDANRRLLVTVLDNVAGKTLLESHPVVRL